MSRHRQAHSYTACGEHTWAHAQMDSFLVAPLQVNAETSSHCEGSNAAQEDSAIKADQRDDHRNQVEPEINPYRTSGRPDRCSSK
jgi:hypothetical protein